MRLVKVEKLKNGNKIAKTILSADGTVLLGQGVNLTPRYIKRLQEIGISSVYIVDERFPDLEVKDIVSETTRTESVKITKQIIERIRKGQDLESPKVLGTINGIIDDLLSQDSLVVNLNDIRTYDDYTFGHSVNVCILSLLIGITLGYDQIKLRNLGIGAILHDLGKVYLPSSILQKNSCLTLEEFKEVQKHCQLGFEIIRANQELNILSAHVALQHHERYDGRGYPQGLKGENILEFARIVAIADVYDALSSDRPYRKRYLPHEIYEYMMASCYSIFDPKLMAHFLKYIPPYPIGTLVRLNTKEKAIIIKQNDTCLIRPIVRVTTETDHAPNNPIEYNLLENPTILVEELLPD